MKYRIALFGALFAFAVFSFVATAYSQMTFIAFSADMVQHYVKQGKETHGRIFITRDKIRIDTEITGSNYSGSVIYRRDRNVYWMLMPQQKMYMEMAIPNQPMYDTALMQPQANRRLVGTEMIDGQLADKYEISGGGNTIFTWIAKGSHIPLRMATADGSYIAEYRNIQEGEPADSVFEIPEGYTKFSSDFSSFSR